MAALDPEAIASMAPGEPIYASEAFTRRSLGAVTIAGGETIHLAVERALGRCTAQSLFLNAHQQIAYIREQLPELADELPAFVGSVSHEDQSYWAQAVLTDDPTEGGRYTPRRLRLPAEFTEKLVQLGIPQAGIHGLAVMHMNGHKKIMSLFPARIHIDRETREGIKFAMQRRQSDLTMLLAAGSPLLQSVTDRR